MDVIACDCPQWRGSLLLLFRAVVQTYIQVLQLRNTAIYWFAKSSIQGRDPLENDGVICNSAARNP